MEIKNINIDNLKIDINGKTQDITYDLLQEINDFSDDIAFIDATDCEGTVQKWVFPQLPNRYIVVLADNGVISDKDNEYHDTIDPDSTFYWK